MIQMPAVSWITIEGSCIQMIQTVVVSWITLVASCLPFLLKESSHKPKDFKLMSYTERAKPYLLATWTIFWFLFWATLAISGVIVIVTCGDGIMATTLIAVARKGQGWEVVNCLYLSPPPPPQFELIIVYIDFVLFLYSQDHSIYINFIECACICAPADDMLRDLHFNILMVLAHINRNSHFCSYM